MTRDDKRSARCTCTVTFANIVAPYRQRILKNFLARSKENKTLYFKATTFLSCARFPWYRVSNPYQACFGDLHGNPELSRWPLRMILSKHACGHTTPIPTASFFVLAQFFGSNPRANEKGEGVTMPGRCCTRGAGQYSSTHSRKKGRIRIRGR